MSEMVGLCMEMLLVCELFATVKTRGAIFNNPIVSYFSILRKVWL
jgi:hypothetical protein